MCFYQFSAFERVYGATKSPSKLPFVYFTIFPRLNETSNGMKTNSRVVNKIDVNVILKTIWYQSQMKQIDGTS